MFICTLDDLLSTGIFHQRLIWRTQRSPCGVCVFYRGYTLEHCWFLSLSCFYFSSKWLWPRAVFNRAHTCMTHTALQDTLFIEHWKFVGIVAFVRCNSSHLSTVMHFGMVHGYTLNHGAILQAIMLSNVQVLVSLLINKWTQLINTTDSFVSHLETNQCSQHSREILISVAVLVLE